MRSVLIILLFTIFKCNLYSCALIETASLSPNDETVNGMTITHLTSDYYKTGVNPEWELYGDDETGFDLQLSLDDRWGFHPTEVTTLRIELTVNTATGSYHDLMVGFTQHNNDEYFVTRLVLDEYLDDHHIYPSCTTSDVQVYASGDIKSIIDNDNGYSRWQKATKYYNGYTYFYPYFDSNRYLANPLVLTLENHPLDNYMKFTYSNTGVADRYCIYSEMVPSMGLNIYLAASTLYYSVDINYITILLDYDAPNPSPDPTTNPVPNEPPYPILLPTSEPTTNPLFQMISSTEIVIDNDIQKQNKQWTNIQYIILCVIMMIFIGILIILTMYKFSKCDGLLIMRKIRMIAILQMIGFFLSYLFWMICVIILNNNNNNRLSVEYIICAIFQYLYWTIGWMLFYVLKTAELLYTFAVNMKIIFDEKDAMINITKMRRHFN